MGTPKSLQSKRSFFEKPLFADCIIDSNMRSSDNLVGSWIEIESSTEEEDSDAEVLE